MLPSFPIVHLCGGAGAPATTGKNGSCRLSKPILIAIVDDDASIRETMKDLVVLLGHDSALFRCAEDFLASGQVSEVSCLVTDVQMPGMSGIDLFDRLLESTDRKPVIFITAYPQDSVRERLLQQGAAGYLTKPLQVGRFIECLNKAVGA